jgi:N-acetylmuramoyl-L-alanine amidase
MKICLFPCLLSLCATALGAGPPVICIDPGHPSEVGRGTHGKKFTEIQVVWRVAVLLKQKLVADGYKVVMTKAAEEQMVRNTARAESANRSGASLLLRLHCDAAPDRGFASYYPSQQGTSEGKRGPSAAVLKSSKAAALKFHPAVMKSLNGLIPDRGLMTDLQTAIGHKQGALTGSIFSKVPVILVEMLVLTNPKDEDVLTNDDGFDRLAEALRQGVHAAVPIK